MHDLWRGWNEVWRLVENRDFAISMLRGHDRKRAKNITYGYGSLWQRLKFLLLSFLRISLLPILALMSLPLPCKTPSLSQF